MNQYLFQARGAHGNREVPRHASCTPALRRSATSNYSPRRQAVAGRPGRVLLRRPRAAAGPRSRADARADERPRRRRGHARERRRGQRNCLKTALTGRSPPSLGDELTEWLRREFEQFRAEAGDRARAGAHGAGILAAAAVSGAVATGAALTCPCLPSSASSARAAPRSSSPWARAALTAYLAKRGLDELGVPTDAAAERVKEAAQQVVSSP